METGYLVNYCLSNETEFEDFHPLYDKKMNELRLAIPEIQKLLKKCEGDADNVGISFKLSVPDKWDAMEIHGVDGLVYTLEYQFGSKAASYFKRHISETRSSLCSRVFAH